MTKNPYEMRLDLLAMAKEVLDQQYTTAQQFAWSMYEKASDKGSPMFNSDVVEKWKDYIPKMYTPEEIIAQAEKLQDFVSSKGDARKK